MFLQMKAHPFISFSISQTVLSCLITTFLCITLCAGNATTRCAGTDKQALLKLKNGFIDQFNGLFSWNDEVDCCKWEGISCNNLTGHVTTLNLWNSALRGKIDSSLCELQHLTFLNLGANEFEAQKIPKCICSLSELRVLMLEDLNLVGTIPHELGNLSNLQALSLGDNDLFTNNLEWISHFSALKYLRLSHVNLSRVVNWPSSISKLSSLAELHFEACELPDVSPISFSFLNTSTTLKVLSLAANNLSSSIIPWVLKSSRVFTDLDLSYNSLQGLIPDGIGTLTSLQYLDFSANELEGGLPKSFHNLCHLKELYLYSNKLSGKLSDLIKQLSHAQSSIEVLNLSDNPFSWGAFPNLTGFSALNQLLLAKAGLCGLLPPSLQHLPHLSSLVLSANNLSGPLPEFTGLASLENLYLDRNQLNGTIPHSMGQLSNLTSLFLNSNKLNGLINEAQLSNLSKLEYLDLSQNQLSFNLSSDWVPPFQLQLLYLTSCNLGPNFPAWFENLWPATYLDISNARISSSIPTWFWDLSPCLLFMNISHNNIFGSLPKSFQKEKSRCFGSDTWDLSFNNLSGPVSQFPPSLINLRLSNNMLSSFVSSFCAIPNLDLQYLDLSNNLLSGKLPDCLGHLQDLRVLDLAKNNLSGRIPNAIGTLRQIESIHLNDNSFSGEIPALMHCHVLKSIDFGENNLQGGLPSWMGYNLSSLIVLRLKANRFQGSIPTSLCHLSNLQILDLSLNNITGKIPHCLSDIIALSNVNSSRKTTISYSRHGQLTGTYAMDKAAVVWKGQEMEYEKYLGLMTTIDLSGNHLEGQIPHTITQLTALASLNLSRNNFTGFIPSSIGKMKMLESLDLSRNHFTGTIPISFSSLTFLSYLNLSFNNLSGQIPLATQLQTFDESSYMGNQGLCGPPLAEKCPGDGSLPTPPSTGNTQINDNEGDDKFISFGFYVSIALGFITGFWAVCGTLVLKTSWRKAYFQFASNVWDWIYVQVVLFIVRMKRKF